MVRTALTSVLVLFVSASAAAQGTAPPLTVEPLPWFVLDLRSGWPGIGDDESTAADLGVNAVDMPQRALTAIAGAHIYPLRRSALKVGIGAELMRGRGRYQRKSADGDPIGSPVTRTLESLAWQASLNFGRGQGWSYVTAGIGSFAFDSFLGEGPGDHPSESVINAGAGGRWFKWRHLGLNVDLRFYLTKAAERGQVSAARASTRIVILSVGATFK